MAIACGVLGLAVGSFLNVVIHRVPRHESVVAPRSRCPGCGHQLEARDNIPVVSWLLLRRRCRHCAMPIPARYPAVEVLTAVLFAAVGARFGVSPALPAYLALAAVLVAVSGIDLEHLVVPKRLVYPASGVGLVLLGGAALALGEAGALVGALAGAAIAWGLLLVIHLVSPRGMGFGDVRLALYLGLHLGWLSLAHVGLGLFLGFVVGAVVSGAALVIGRVGRRQQVPFAPFLAAGTLLAVLVGTPLLGRYPPTAGVAPVASASLVHTLVAGVETVRVVR